MTEALLVLADGETFEGEAVGYQPERRRGDRRSRVQHLARGLPGDPHRSVVRGQIITFTYPHIGNYGVNERDDEARAPRCRGVIVRDLARRPSNWRATDDLDGFLGRHEVSGIAGIDTRRLTRHIRSAGAIPGAFGIADRDTLLAAAQSDGGTDGRDLASVVTHAQSRTPSGPTTRRFTWSRTTSASSVRSSTNSSARAARSRWYPRARAAPKCSARAPDGVFLSNGPGDPAAVATARAERAATCSATSPCSASASATRS